MLYAWTACHEHNMLRNLGNMLPPISSDNVVVTIPCLFELQAYVKAGAGEKGFGPLSVGFIVDKTIDL